MRLGHGVPFVFIVPWPSDSKEYFRWLPRALRRRGLSSHHFVVGAECAYQAIATAPELLERSSLSDVFKNMVTQARGDPVANHKKVLQEKLGRLRAQPSDGEEKDEDMTRQVIKQPAKLHDKDLQSERMKQNADAI